MEESIINVKQLYKKFKNKEVIKGIDFKLNAGDIVGILGPNGVGKTTIIKMLCRINNPSRGDISIDSSKKISVIFDFNGLYQHFNAIENLSLFCTDGNDSAIEEMLKVVDLWEWRYKKVKIYSKGMLRKLTIARALLQNPDVLILDEPFDGIDIESRKYWIDFFNKWIKEKDRSIIISSHIMSDIENMCNRLIILKDGQILYNESTETLQRENVEYVKIEFNNEHKCEKISNLLSKYDVTVKQDFSRLEAEIYNLKHEMIGHAVKDLCDNGVLINAVYEKKNNMTDTYVELLNENEDKEE